MKSPKAMLAVGLGVVIVSAIVAIVIMVIDPPEAWTSGGAVAPRAAVGDGELATREQAVAHADEAAAEPEIDSSIGPAAEVEDDTGEIRGVVRTVDGLRLPGFVTVSLYRVSGTSDNYGPQVAYAICARDGSFRFSRPRGNDYFLRAENRDALVSSPYVAAHPQVPSVSLVLSDRFKVRGQVTDPDGNPLSAARVLLLPDADDRRAVARFTDASGKFEFTRVAGGVVRIEARHNLYRPVSQRITIGGVERISLNFERVSIAINGRVEELQGGAPIEGAEVRVLPNEANRELYLPDTATTAADGTFQLLGQAPGNRWVEVRHPEFSGVSRVVQVTDNTPSIDFQVVPRTRVSGTLVGPVMGNEVLMLRGVSGEFARAEVDDSGAFEFDAEISVGAVVLEFEEGELAFAESRRRELTVRLSEVRVNELAVEVQPASVVTGTVLDPEGNPVVGAMFSAVPPNRSAGGSILGWALERLTDLDRAVATRGGRRVVAVTDSAGSFRVAGLPQGEIGLLIDTADLARRQILVDVPEVGAPPRELGDVVLEAGAAIRGAVTQEGSNLPVAGAYVFVNTPETGLVSAISGNDGGFVLNRLAAGEYRVKARFSNLPTARSAKVVVRAGSEVESRLRFPAGRVVSGLVVGGDDRPLAGAIVMVSGIAGTEVRSEADGTFELSAPPSEVEVWAYTEDREVQAFAPLGPEQESIRLQLATRPSGGARGQVVLLPSRKPVSAGILRVRRPEGDEIVETARGVSMPDGRLDVAGIPTGPVQLILHCAGAAPAVRDVEVVTGEVLDLGTLFLEPGSQVRGVIVDGDGEPVAGATVFLGNLADRRELTRVGAAPTQLTDAAGRFALDGVAWCARRLMVSAPGFAVVAVDLEIPRDLLRADPLTVSLAVGSTVEVVVVDAEGAAWERGFIQLTCDGAPLAVQPVGEGGFVQFTNIGPGSYELAILGRSTAIVSVDVDAGAVMVPARIVVE